MFDDDRRWENFEKARLYLTRTHPGTIKDKFMVGYQGWFTCAGDGEPVHRGHHGWLHWFNYPIPHGGRPNTDLWPEVSEYSPEELYPAPGLHFSNGEQAKLFSSRHPRTVQRHFHWMAEHGVDGVFLQRFASHCAEGKEDLRRMRDEITIRVREAAEKEGRVFSIMYDVTGMAPDRIEGIIKHDWAHLVHDLNILESPNYLRDRERPVVALWGFGFDGGKFDPNTVRDISHWLRHFTPGGAYLFGGVPTCWRTADNDGDRNPDFLKIFLNEFDAISPWLVGRFRTEEDATRFAENRMKDDVTLINETNEEFAKHGVDRKIDYVPVVWPGFSGLNLSEGKWQLNMVKRNGGRFLWQQIVNAKRLGVRILYGAMWDEYDEGTAFLPVVEKSRNLPKTEDDKFQFLALDADGYDLPSDWYMRIAGFAAEALRSERMVHDSFPVKELQDYWAGRPRYESPAKRRETLDMIEGAGASGSGFGGGGGGSGGGQSYEEWLAANKEVKDEAPPPPYTLEAEDEPAGAGSAETIVPQPGTATQGASNASFPQVAPATTRPSASPPPSVPAATRPLQADPVSASINALADDLARQDLAGASAYYNSAPAPPLSTSPQPNMPPRPSMSPQPSLPPRPSTSPRPTSSTSPRPPAPPMHPAHPGSASILPRPQGPYQPPPSHPARPANTTRPTPPLASRPSASALRPHPTSASRPPPPPVVRHDSRPGSSHQPDLPARPGGHRPPPVSVYPGSPTHSTFAVQGSSSHSLPTSPHAIPIFTPPVMPHSPGSRPSSPYHSGSSSFQASSPYQAASSPYQSSSSSYQPSLSSYPSSPYQPGYMNNPPPASPAFGAAGSSYPGSSSTSTYPGASTYPGQEAGSSQYPSLGSTSQYPGGPAPYGGPSAPPAGYGHTGGSSYPGMQPTPPGGSSYPGGPSGSSQPELPYVPYRHHHAAASPSPANVPAAPGTPAPPQAQQSTPGGSNYVNYALDAVDKFGGRKARDRVDSVMTTGSKLLGRFTK
uniref:Xylosidase/arabinosidase n=1 Tax=Schizophyllum commune (strain H4-8 / FGSC 9210) TaxID=578458 RepID=D8Q9L4_SCHCM